MNCRYQESGWADWQANLDDEYWQNNHMHGIGEFALNLSLRLVLSRVKWRLWRKFAIGGGGPSELNDASPRCRFSHGRS